jgi:hypothetical protein
VVINNHLIPKSADNRLQGNVQPPVLLTEPQRIEQARIINDYVDSLLALNSERNIVVLGDLNEFAFSSPVRVISGALSATGSSISPGTPVLTNLGEALLPAKEQYGYNFEGNGNELDHILASNALFTNGAAEFDAVHVNAEFPLLTAAGLTGASPVGASDHDPLVARFTVSNLSETLTGTSAADIILGLGGNDTITGGTGMDSLNGGAANDTFIVAVGDMVTGETYNGGTGTDTIQFAAGTHSLVGVTLTDIESITLASAPSNTLTLGAASQAGLIAAAPGANDLVIFDGFLTSAQVYGIAAAGVEKVQFVSGHGTNMANFNAGVLQSIDITFDPSNTLFNTATLDYFTSPVLISKAVYNWDNGLRTTQNYALDGTLTSYVQEDLANIATDYNRLENFYTAGVLQKMVYDLDNGDRSQHAVTAGQTLTGDFKNDSMTGFDGGADTFVFVPTGTNGNDFIANFEDGVDVINLAAFGFADFAAVQAISVGDVGYTYLNFSGGGYLMVNGLSFSNFDASDVILA